MFLSLRQHAFQTGLQRFLQHTVLAFNYQTAGLDRRPDGGRGNQLRTCGDQQMPADVGGSDAGQTQRVLFGEMDLKVPVGAAGCTRRDSLAHCKFLQSNNGQRRLVTPVTVRCGREREGCERETPGE
jgi:hypothetical protein